MKRNYKKIGFYCLPIFMLLLTLYTCFNNTLWVDEVYSLELSNHPIWELIKIDSLDVHPPLYYIILRVVSFLLLPVLGNAIWVGKIASMIPYIILVILGFTKIKKKYGEVTAFLFNIFIVGMPRMSVYATEIRMYSWGMLFVMCAFWQLIKINEDGTKITDYFKLTLFSVLAAYTHYFACAAAIVIYLELIAIAIISRDLKKFRNTFLSGLGVVVLYIPWIAIFISQVSNVKDDYWIEPITIGLIKEYFWFLFGDNRFLKYVFAFVFTIALIKSIKSSIRDKKIESWLGILVWIGTIGLGVVLSLAIRPIFVSRYMISAAACFWFGIACALSQINYKKYLSVVLSVFTLLCLMSTLLAVRNDYRAEAKTESLLSCLDDIVTDDTVIISDFNHVQRTLGYYYQKNQSVVVAEQLSDLTLKVYSDCKLSRITDNNGINSFDKKYIVLVDCVNDDNDFRKWLDENDIKYSENGHFSLDWYKFDILTVAE